MGEDSNMASHALARSPVPGCCRSRFRSLCEAALVYFRCRISEALGPDAQPAGEREPMKIKGEPCTAQGGSTGRGSLPHLWKKGCRGSSPDTPPGAHDREGFALRAPPVTCTCLYLSLAERSQPFRWHIIFWPVYSRQNYWTGSMLIDLWICNG